MKHKEEQLKHQEMIQQMEEPLEALPQDLQGPIPKRYEESDVDPRIIRAVKELGFEAMTPIQEQAIPALLSGRDVIGQAQTGTGKTAAFGIPAIEMIDPKLDAIQCLILCPTRELAIQAADELRNFTKYMSDIRILPIYGGQDITKQIRSLKGSIKIIVGTPGRVMDHMRRHTIRLDELKMVVLDEADEMLAMGFREDMETILAQVPKGHQTALFSATMPQPILDITHMYQTDPVYIKVAKKELTIPLVKQSYYEVRREDKEEVIARLLDYYNPKRSLVFCNTKKMVDDLTERLKGRGYFAEALHGDLTQMQRDRVMNGFRNDTVEILVATDVAARGIDVTDVEAVFNYDVPQDIEYYVHRIGRTGRAGKKGRSFTLVSGREIFKIRDIEHVCHTKIKKKTVPSPMDVVGAKAEKILAQITQTLNEQDISLMETYVEQYLSENELTASMVAAAFLKREMGEMPTELPEIVDRYHGGKRGRSKEDGQKRRRKDAEQRREREDGQKRRRKAGEQKRDWEDGQKRRRKDGEQKHDRENKSKRRKRDEVHSFAKYEK